MTKCNIAFDELLKEYEKQSGSPEHLAAYKIYDKLSRQVTRERKDNGTLAKDPCPLVIKNKDCLNCHQCHLSLIGGIAGKLKRRTNVIQQEKKGDC